MAPDASGDGTHAKAWKAMQIIVILAVIASSIHWQWTDNHYLPLVLGVVAASAATRIVLLWIALVAKVRQFQSRRAQVKGAVGRIPVGDIDASRVQYPRELSGR